MRTKYLVVIALLLSFLAWTPDGTQAAVRHHRRRYRHGYVVKRRSRRRRLRLSVGALRLARVSVLWPAAKREQQLVLASVARAVLPTT